MVTSSVRRWATDGREPSNPGNQADRGVDIWGLRTAQVVFRESCLLAILLASLATVQLSSYLSLLADQNLTQLTAELTNPIYGSLSQAGGSSPEKLLSAAPLL